MSVYARVRGVSVRANGLLRGRRCEDLCHKLVKCDQTATQLIMQDPHFVPALSTGIIKDTHSCDKPTAGPCGVILGGGGTAQPCHCDECLRGGGNVLNKYML